MKPTGQPPSTAASAAPGEVSIRAARPHDSPSLAALCAQLGYPAEHEVIQERLNDLLDRDEHVIYVAQGADGEIIGWVHACIHRLLIEDVHVEIGGLVVDEGHRGRAAGRLLMDSAEQWARERGCAAVYLRSSLRRKGAHRFYERVGYVNTKTSLTFEKILS